MDLGWLMGKQLPKPTKQQLASDPRASVWVNASAGSGKTHVLVDRLIRLLLSGSRPSAIVCLTYTRAAAAEMSARLLERLSQWITLSDEALIERLVGLGETTPAADDLAKARRLFATVLETPGGLKIQTLHAFCEAVLRQFPVESGFAPHFRVLDERAAHSLLEDARNKILERALGNENGALGSALKSFSSFGGLDDLGQVIEDLQEERTKSGSIVLGQMTAEILPLELEALFGLSSSEQPSTDFNFITARYGALAECLSSGSPRDRKIAVEVSEAIANEDSFRVFLQKFYLTSRGEKRAMTGLVTRKTLEKHPWLNDFLVEEQDRLLRSEFDLIDRKTISATTAAFLLGSAILTEYEKLKRNASACDFNDLVERVGQLLKDPEDASWVLYKLDGGIDHFLVDEAQDTNPLQWRVVESLIADFFAGAGTRTTASRTVFVVGDRKQSIFSFQGADLDAYRAFRFRLGEIAEAAGQKFHDLDFTVSYRSSQVILDAVDLTFARRSSTAVNSETWSSMMEHQSSRPSDMGLVEIWPAIGSLEKEQRTPWTVPKDLQPAESPHRRLAQQIAEGIKSWIAKRLLPASGRTILPGDIMILLRTRGPLLDAIIRELRKGGVPVSGSDRLVLHENIAVQDLVALGRVCLMPEDDYSLACVLKSPIVENAVTEDQLFMLAHDRGRDSLWSKLQDSLQEDLQHIAKFLKGVREIALNQTPFQFYTWLIAMTRGRFIRRLGSEAVDALSAFLELAADFEQKHASSLQAFLDWFEAGSTDVRRNLDQTSDEVRVMTIHGAKGLEAPIVVLPDTTSLPIGGRTRSMMFVNGGGGHRLPLWRLSGQPVTPAMSVVLDREGDGRLSEYWRLLYVAMTRAREELYICGCHGRAEMPADCWYSLIAARLRPVMKQLDNDSGWRLGADPQFITSEIRPQTLPQTSLPSWIMNSPMMRGMDNPRSAFSPNPISVAQPAEIDSRGEQLRNALELVAGEPQAHWPMLLEQLSARGALSVDVWQETSTLLDDQAVRALLQEPGQSRLPFTMLHPVSGKPLNGNIDRLVKRSEELVIVAFLSKESDQDRDIAVTRANLERLAIWKLAVANSFPGKRIRCMELRTWDPKLIELPEQLLDRAVLETEAGAP